MPIHTAVARNFAAASENRIHSDEVARRFGFTGALVPGVTVFAHLTAPLTKRFGARWLERSRVTTRFNKPAYEGDALTVVDVDREGGLIAVECFERGRAVPSGEWEGTRWEERRARGSSASSTS